MPKALGLVETRGLVAAIEAADAMVKTSNVKLIGREVTRPALVTIKIVGDVAAVKASVDAGAAAASKVGELVSIHVIPQPDSQMISMLPEIKDEETIRTKTTRFSKKPDPKESEKIEEPGEEIKTKAEIKEPAEEKDKALTDTKPRKAKSITDKKSSESDDQYSVTTDHLEKLRREALGIKTAGAESKKEKKSGELPGKISYEELENLNVHQLRKKARATEGFPIQGREISRANRNELLNYFKKLF